MDTIDTALHKGRNAFRGNAWADAYSHFSAADLASPLGIDDLELLATSAYLIGKDEISGQLWARAHQACVRSRDIPRAARFAFWLALDLFVKGEIAQAGGWLARGQHLLDDSCRDCPERGLLLTLVARVHLKRGNMQSAFDTALEAVDIGARFGDPELRVFGRLVLGQVLAAKGDLTDAAALFDEAMVAVTVGDVSPVGVGIVYCAVIEACHQIFDVQRARGWTEALSRWCASQPDLVPFRGQCLVHRAEILRLSGVWSEALVESGRAVAWLSPLVDRIEGSSGNSKAPQPRFPIGAALYELAELHRMRGDFESAEDAFREASRRGYAPEPGLALLRLAQGRLKDAEATARRLLGESQSRLKRTGVLAACVEIMIAATDLPTARAAADELSSIATATDAQFLRAVAAQSMGSVLLAERDARAALPELRTAWVTWQELEVPYNAARVRVLLGLAYRELDDPAAAELELDAALRVFERLAATTDIEHTKILMSASRADVSPLTRREVQVIELIATGKTNRAIARQLAISERTVERHVSNILMKLDLPSRSAATAYAYEHGLM